MELIINDEKDKQTLKTKLCDDPQLFRQNTISPNTILCQFENSSEEYCNIANTMRNDIILSFNKVTVNNRHVIFDRIHPRKNFGHTYEFVKIKPHYLCYLEAWKYVETSFVNGVLNCPCPNSALKKKVKLTFTNVEAFVEYGISNGGYLRYYLPTIVDPNDEDHNRIVISPVHRPSTDA